MKLSKRHRIIGASAVLLLAGLGIGLGLAMTGGSTKTPLGSVRATAPSTRGGMSSATSTPPAQDVAGLPPCTLADVTVAAGAVRHQADFNWVPLVVTNRSASACQLAGFPTVVGHAESGASTGEAQQLAGGFLGGELNGAPRAVRLDAGGHASAALEAASRQLGKGGGSCQMVATVSMALPESSAATTVSLALVDCFGFVVHPFVSGVNGI